jgi:hypothetical protein
MFVSSFNLAKRKPPFRYIRNSRQIIILLIYPAGSAQLQLPAGLQNNDEFKNDKILHIIISKFDFDVFKLFAKIKAAIRRPLYLIDY